MGNILAGHMHPYADTWNTKVKDSNNKNNNKTHTQKNFQKTIIVFFNIICDRLLSYWC